MAAQNRARKKAMQESGCEDTDSMFGPEQPCVRRPFVSTPSHRRTQMLVARSSCGQIGACHLARAIRRVHALDTPGVGSGLLRGNAAKSSDGNESIADRV